MGRWLSSSGYWMIYNPDHPYCNSNGCVPEHRFMVELMIGRYIDPQKEHVHHINAIKTDNRIDNLQLLTRSEHLSLTYKDNKFAKGHKNNGNIGHRHTEESKLKNRLAHLGRKHTDEAKRKVSLSLLGNTRAKRNRVPA